MLPKVRRIVDRMFNPHGDADPPIIPFKLGSQGQPKILSNLWLCRIEIAGKIYPSAEHAYQTAKAKICIGEDFILNKVLKGIEERTDPKEVMEYGKLIEEWGRNNSGKHGEGLKRSKLWNELRVDVMEAILIAKVSQHDQVYKYLVSTGTKVIAEATFNKFWGCGMSEYQAKRSMQNSIQLHGNADMWVPPNGYESNLGKLWMRVREFFVHGTGTIKPALLVGDSMIRGIELPNTKTCCWPGGKTEHGFLLVDLLQTEYTRVVLFHFGTNDIPRYHPSDPNYVLERESQDGAIQVSNLNELSDMIMSLMLQYMANHRKNNAYNEMTRFVFSDVLPRHCDFSETKETKNPYHLESRAQRRVDEINELWRWIKKRVVRQYIDDDGDEQAYIVCLNENLKCLAHPKFANEGLFERKRCEHQVCMVLYNSLFREQACFLCKATPESGEHPDRGFVTHPDLHLNDNGKTELRNDMLGYLTRMGYGYAQE